MNIADHIKTLSGIRDEIKTALKSGEHVLEALEPVRDEKGAIRAGISPTARKVPTGHYANATGHLQMAITNLEGFLAKTAEIEAANKAAVCTIEDKQAESEIKPAA